MSVRETVWFVRMTERENPNARAHTQGEAKTGQFLISTSYDKDRGQV